MLENAEAVGAVEADQVEARGLAALGGVDEPVAQVADILLIQRAGVDGIVGEGSDRQRRRRQRNFLGIEVGTVDPGIGQLDAGQRAVLLDAAGHLGDHRNVVVVPQPQLDKGRDFGGVVHLALFGENHAPATLRLDPAHLRNR